MNPGKSLQLNASPCGKSPPEPQNPQTPNPKTLKPSNPKPPQSLKPQNPQTLKPSNPKPPQTPQNQGLPSPLAARAREAAPGAEGPGSGVEVGVRDAEALEHLRSLLGVVQV